MKFEKGQSGNPAGKPRGARNKVTLALEELLNGEAEALTRKAIDLAKGGDGPALRMCLERLLPPRKDRPVVFDMPRLESPADALKAATSIVEAVALGDLTPSEAADLTRTVESFSKVAETADMADRLKKLEQRMTANKQ